MEFKDYYKTLGVSRDVKPDELKRAYRRLARKYHPDVSQEANAEEQFKTVQEAYEVLKDPEKRAAYDRFGANWQAGQEFHPPPDWDPDIKFSGGGYTDAGDFSDFFETLFGAAGRRGHSRRGPLRSAGEDLHARVQITLEDAFNGATRSVTLQNSELDDTGRPVRRNRTLNVKVPRGVTAGQRIRLAGQGGPGGGGAPAGDLYMEVLFEPHRLFRSDGRDVYIDLPVAPWEAALGRSVAVPTLGGKVNLKIPPDTPSGSTLRLKGRGLPGNPAGDQYVVIDIVTPTATSAAARALYEQMEREMAFDPRAHLGG